MEIVSGYFLDLKFFVVRNAWKYERIIVAYTLARFFYVLYKFGTYSLAILLLLKSPVVPFKVEY